MKERERYFGRVSGERESYDLARMRSKERKGFSLAGLATNTISKERRKKQGGNKEEMSE